MDVQCPNCGGEYTLDESLVATSGTSVRCTQCSYVFKVYRPTAGSGETDEWFVRRPVSGETIRFERLGVLQQWIATGRVDKNDLFSRGDDTWKRLGDIPEMLPFFETTGESPTRPSGGDSISAGYPKVTPSEIDTTVKTTGLRPAAVSSGAITLPPPPMARPISAPHERQSATALARPLAAQSAAPLPGSSKKSTPPRPAKTEPDFSEVPAAAEPEDWQQGEAPKLDEPAWAGKPGAQTMRPEALSGFLPPRKRRIGRAIAAGLLLLAVGGGIYVFVAGPSSLAKLANKYLASPSDDRFNQFFARGRESFLLDSEVPHYRQADIEYQKALALNEHHAPTMAALAELHATWAQSLRDTEVDVASDEAAAGGARDPRKVDWLRREYDLRLAEAGRWAEQARTIAADLPESRRASADVLRLQGELDKARELLRDSGATDPETRYQLVMIALDEGNAPSTLLPELDSILAESPLPRVLYRKARVLASMKREKEARATLAKLFELNQDHLRGRDLLSRIDAKLPVLLAVRQSQQDTGADTAMVDAEPNPTEKAAPIPTLAPKVPTAAPPTPARPAKAAAPVEDQPRGGSGKGTESLLMKAASLQRGGRCAEAMPVFEQVLEQAPANLDAIVGLASCQRERGSFGQAITLYRRALGINPVFGPALYGLADAFKAQGQDEQAIKYYRQYLSASPSGRQAQAARQAIETLSESPAKEAPPPSEPSEPSEPSPSPSPSPPTTTEGDTGNPQ